MLFQGRSLPSQNIYQIPKNSRLSLMGAELPFSCDVIGFIFGQIDGWITAHPTIFNDVPINICGVSVIVPFAVFIP